MSDVERLLSQYIAEHKAGAEANPLEYLEQLTGTDRAELAALIDEYLARSPGRAWDPEAYQGSSAELLADRLAHAFSGEAGLWPVVLPRLRERAQILRADVVRRLAESLGVTGKEEKVESYYHDMEQGLLPAEAVKQTVLERLGEIFGTSADFLSQAGQRLGEGGAPGAPSEAFTRTAPAKPASVEVADRDARATASRAPESGEPEWDEVDELFRGGPD